MNKEIINTNKFSLSHLTFEIPQPLDRDKTCMVMVEAEIDKVETIDNQDGTFNQVFKARHKGTCSVEQSGTVIKGKSKSTISRRMRARAWIAAQEKGVEEEKYYEEMGNKIIVYWESIEEFLKGKS